jgi:hypothetical protein
MGNARKPDCSATGKAQAKARRWTRSLFVAASTFALHLSRRNAVPFN